MKGCASFSMEGPTGLAEVLQGVDCATRQATAFAFDRLFGGHGALAGVLTGALTLYVALLALGLLTGRGGLRAAMLTPRALTIGLVITFATSWTAYQQVVWNLAAGAPDEIARLLLGSPGPAADHFARLLDSNFDRLADAAAQAPPPEAGAGGKPTLIGPAELIWLGGIVLLASSAGVLIVAKLALAVLLGVGPLFIVLALFGGTRGLFEGWARATALFALAPLVTVLVGMAALALIQPLLLSLSVAGTGASMRQAICVLLAALVHAALMGVALKTAATLVSTWRPLVAWGRGGASGSAAIPWLAPSASAMGRAGGALLAPAIPPSGATQARAPTATQDERTRQLVAATLHLTPAAAPRHVGESTGSVGRLPTLRRARALLRTRRPPVSPDSGTSP